MLRVFYDDGERCWEPQQKVVLLDASLSRDMPVAYWIGKRCSVLWADGWYEGVITEYKPDPTPTPEKAVLLNALRLNSTSNVSESVGLQSALPGNPAAQPQPSPSAPLPRSGHTTLLNSSPPPPAVPVAPTKSEKNRLSDLSTAAAGVASLSALKAESTVVVPTASATETERKRIYVLYDDGDEAWEPIDKVVRIGGPKSVRVKVLWKEGYFEGSVIPDHLLKPRTVVPAHSLSAVPAVDSEFNRPHVNKFRRAWSAKEVERLHLALEKFGRDWVAVSRFVGNRSNTECCSKARKEIDQGRMADIDGKKTRMRRWSKIDVEKLRVAINRFGKDWDAVSAYVSSLETEADFLDTQPPHVCKSPVPREVFFRSAEECKKKAHYEIRKGRVYDGITRIDDDGGDSDEDEDEDEDEDDVDKDIEN